MTFLSLCCPQKPRSRRVRLSQSRMMTFVKGLMLLLMVAAANAAPGNCDGLNHTNTISAKDLKKILGDWVLVWSASNHQEGWDLLRNISSSHVELSMHTNETVELVERNMHKGGVCDKYSVNMSMPSDLDDFKLTFSSTEYIKDGAVTIEDEHGIVYFLETSCDDCMAMIYSMNETKYLLFYKREGHHQDLAKLKEDHVMYMEIADCKHIPHDIIFTYDGVADFCHKKSAPEHHVEDVVVVPEPDVPTVPPPPPPTPESS
ncbi:saxitoxin and tetrodotoxin-binding protein 1-like [Xyrichtys novacula]|uniref:Saxitoxin and tetrodotoxin-binding protein 1-like n=1 Tax=Xyrichtys novacula TaxID=13765 RepID=A0AAV1HE64_XYRNO|nr:saxitoxin and tetrodotoxin-binding protein 1-like [Xyrichtys novacula]